MRAFPMLLIVVILYNMLAFGGAAAGHPMAELLARGVPPIPMFSGDKWSVSLGDCLLLLGFLLLFIETVGATRSSSRALINHGLSMLTFVIALVEFIVLKGFSTSVFFFILVMTLFDVVAGYTISIVAARRDLNLTETDRH
jgi:hypothetical protein